MYEGAFIVGRVSFSIANPYEAPKFVDLPYKQQRERGGGPDPRDSHFA